MSIIFDVARKCVVKTTLMMVATIIFFSVVAMVVHEFDSIVFIFKKVLFWVSFGGYFWGGVISSLLGAFIFAWSACVFFKLGSMLKAELGSNAVWLNRTIVIMLCGVVLWFLGYLSVYFIFDEMEEWNAFHGAAYVLLYIPILVFVMFLLMF